MTSTAGRLLHRCVGALTLITLALLPATPTAPAGTDGTQLRLAAAPTAGTAPLVLTTVPAVAGFPVTLDGVTALTDAEGKAHFDAPVTDEALSDRITLTEAELPIGGRQVRVSAERVYPSVREPLLALDLSYLASFSFSGTDGSPVAASSIESFTVKCETGEVVDVTPGEDVWLQGSRVVKRTGFMEVKNLRWSVQQVTFAGSNVVNASQQEFFPAEHQGVDVALLFFRLDLQVHDAMFGFSSGSAIDLVYPDGETRRFGLDDGGRLSVPELPRGDYTLTIVGPGPPMSRPLAVSRDQSVDLAFHSWLDVLTVLTAVLGLAGALALSGRIRRRDAAEDPRHRGPRRRLVRRHHAEEGEPASDPSTDEGAVLPRGQLAG